MEEARRVLFDDFNLKSFRNHQESVIQRLLVEKQSALAIMPTGSGKSLCYQVPALCLDGLTLVVSPLLSLMKDQVDGLVRKGIKAGRLDSSQSQQEARNTMASLESGELKILYVAPERLNVERFMQIIKDFKIALLAVDESHCVAEWGNGFRPDYLKIARFAVEYKAERILCLTATATPSVAQEICQAFSIDEKVGVFRANTYRPNLKLTIQSLSSDSKGTKRLDMAVKLCLDNPATTIIYVTSQKNTEVVAAHLRANGIKAMPYHAGLSDAVRAQTQEWFMTTPNAVMCGTIAFGMGIDHATIRNVIHFNVPKTLEGYSQEVGRAGRDGLPSNCTLFFCQDDRTMLENFARGLTPSRASVKAFIKHICQQAVAHQNEDDGVFTVKHSELEQLFDIREVTILILFAQLELRYGFVRVIASNFSGFHYKESEKPSVFDNISEDNSPVSVAIRKYATLEGEWHVIDANGVTRATGIHRDIVRDKLNEWSTNKWIKLKYPQRQHQYKVLKAFPEDPSEIEAIGDQMYEQLEKKEKLEVERIEKVFRWAADYVCLARGLAEYFGDTGSFPGPDSECGQCTVCTDGPISIYHAPPAPFNEFDFQEILRTTWIRDDARFLARIAFGITSPRISAHGLHRKDVFGSMQRQNFDELMARFQAEVDRGVTSRVNNDWMALVGEGPRYTSKRKWAGSSSKSGGGSWGKYGKRFKY